MTNTSKTLEVLVDGDKLQQVDQFGYLGSRITSDADCKGVVKTRFAMDMATMVKLIKMWKKQGNKHQYNATTY